MDDRLTTPPPGPARSAEQSTPLSKGSGSHSTSALHHTQEHYAPYLEEDLVNEAFITVDEFLHEILRVPAGWEDTRKIPDTAAFKKKMDKYTATDISKETALYHPFVELANDCLAQLRVEWKNLQFCRNNPVIVRGSKGARKPDVVNVKGPTVNLSGRLGVDEMAQDGPEGAAFHWRELLSFWEFKLAGTWATISIWYPTEKANRAYDEGCPRCGHGSTEGHKEESPRRACTEKSTSRVDFEGGIRVRVRAEGSERRFPEHSSAGPEEGKILERRS